LPNGGASRCQLLVKADVVDEPTLGLEVLRCGLDRAILDRLALRGGELPAERASGATVSTSHTSSLSAKLVFDQGVEQRG
jgi:hypothetical protein